MLTIHEVAERSGESLHTIQYWRKLDLLPDPTGVKKRVIFFEEGILQRIAWIRKKQAEGLSLDDIRKLIETPPVRTPEIIYQEYEDGSDEQINALREEIGRLKTLVAAKQLDHEDLVVFREKWTGPQCKNEVCNLLGLDSMLTGTPKILPAPHEDGAENDIAGLKIYVTIPSDGSVHFAEIDVDVYKDPVLCRTETVSSKIYGILFYILGQDIVKQNSTLDSNDLPWILFTNEKLPFSRIIEAAQATLYLLNVGEKVAEIMKDSK